MGYWHKLNEKFDNKDFEEVVYYDNLRQVTNFAKLNYPGYKYFPVEVIQGFFEKYKNSTILYSNKGIVQGFTVYQEWPDVYNFIMICLPTLDTKERVREIIKGIKTKNILPRKKPIVWWDEENMKGRGQLCHQ